MERTSGSGPSIRAVHVPVLEARNSLQIYEIPSAKGAPMYLRNTQRMNFLVEHPSTLQT
jgi:hypothetical protein